MASSSMFDDVQMAPPIEVFRLNRLYAEAEGTKINLGVGAYRTDEGKPYLLPVVSKVEEQMATTNRSPHEYLPVAGLKAFRQAACRLILGEDSEAIVENRVEGIQCLGGTGCIRLAAAFYKTQLGLDTVYVSKPTWGNHKTVFKHAQFSNICEYRYWDPNTRGLDIEGMLEDLGKAPERAVVILHAVAHNPTGVDPTKEQWARIAQVCKARNLTVLMDNAYQGFASGDLDQDAYSSRLFVKEKFEFFIAQSFSKNFGLYNERTGNLCIVANKSSVINNIMSQMEILVRTIWSNPPNHGANVVATVLNNNALFSEWRQSVREMAGRIQAMRKLLFEKLRVLGVPGNWEHITNQIGMFCYTGLNPDQVGRLQEGYNIFLLKEGRINMCAVTNSNVDYLANAIKDVLTEQSS